MTSLDGAVALLLGVAEFSARLHQIDVLLEHLGGAGLLATEHADLAGAVRAAVAKREAAAAPDVKSVLANLANRADARQRQEEAEVIGEIGIVASDGAAASKVFRLERIPIGRDDELGRRAGAHGPVGAPGQQRSQLVASLG